VDVASIAARFGGGGHKQAAGLNVPGLIPEIREKLLQAFSQYFDEG
jgi:phosphoesterase RecJ-like protein